MSLKNEIYSLIDKIIEQEDELNRCKNNKDNQNILSNISKNKQRIDSLSSLIVKDSQIAEEKIKILTEEILGMESEISNSDRPNTNFTQKDLDQNLIKEKFILKTIKIHENELIQIDENLKLLKEEKLSSSNELLNLMSLRENYEELIKTRSKYIFKSSKLKKNIYEKTESNITEIDLNKLNDNNFDINKTKLEYHDLLNIQSINKLSNFIYKIISSNIVATFSSLLIDLNLKNVILSCIENAYNKFNKNNFHFTYNKANSFIREISVNIVNSDIKISNLFIEPQFEILLKYIFKLFSIEKTINDELKFVNNDYTYNKNSLKAKKENIINKLNDYNKQKKLLESEKAKIKNDCKLTQNYFGKIKEYKDMIKMKENEIKQIKNELLVTQNMYQGQINNLKNSNYNLENRYNNINSKYKIENINQQIDFLFKDIKKRIKNVEENEKNNLIKEMIHDIDKCLENDSNLTYNKNINYNINDFDGFSNISKNQSNIEANEKLNNLMNKNINNEHEIDSNVKFTNENDIEDKRKNITQNEDNMSDDLLSSYNSLDDFNLNTKSKNFINENDDYNDYINRTNNKSNKRNSNNNDIYMKNKDKKLKVVGSEKIMYPLINNKKNSFSKENLNINHTNYLKLSECFKLNK